MSIECDCSSDEGEETRCCLTRTIRARKRHECIECREAIEPGQRYERTTGISGDGCPFSDATCLPCAAIRAHYCPHGAIIGGLADQIEECIGWDYREDPPDEHDPFFDGNVPVREVAA